jgi:hypothetical protein
MTATTRRVLRTEVVRGRAPPAALAFAAASAAMLMNETEDWPAAARDCDTAALTDLARELR